MVLIPILNDGSYLGVVPGQVYALKVADGLQVVGNFRILDLGQSGAAGYVDLITAGCLADRHRQRVERGGPDAHGYQAR